MAHSVI